MLAFVAAAVAAAAAACKDPTELTVTITTTEPCADISAVKTVVAPTPLETQSRFERGFVTGATDQCDGQGFVGTLVITPGGEGGSILVAVGVRGADGSPAPDATQCSSPGVEKQCILARRTFSFVEHKPLALPIELDPRCLGKACDPSSTCFRGACVDSAVVCNGGDCGLPDEHPGEPEPVGEGGAGDGSSSDGAYDAELDVGIDDGQVAHDAVSTSDAQVEGGSDATLPYPPCTTGGGWFYCHATSNGTIGTCSGGAGTCCTCTCPVSAAVVSCTVFASSMSSGCSGMGC